MIRLLAVLIFISPSVALAQVQIQPAPTQTAAQMTSVISQWALTLEALQKQNADLQKENADLKEKLGKGNAEQK